MSNKVYLDEESVWKSVNDAMEKVAQLVYSYCEDIVDEAVKEYKEENYDVQEYIDSSIDGSNYVNNKYYSSIIPMALPEIADDRRFEFKDNTDYNINDRNDLLTYYIMEMIAYDILSEKYPDIEKEVI